MSKDELLKSLGLDDALPPVPESDQGFPPRGESRAAAAVAAGPYCLKLDQWGRRRGEEVVSQNERMQQSLGYKTEWKVEGGAARLDSSQVRLAGQTAADLFGLAFEPEPELEQACQDETRMEFVRNLVDTREYQALHEVTRLDEVASEIAATSFAEALAALRKPERDAKGKEDPDQDIEALKAAGRALKDATSEVEALYEARQACGMGEGDAGGKYDARKSVELYRKIRTNPMLRRIFDQAGRFRRVAQSRQRSKPTHGTDDMVGVVLGGDVSKLLASELGAMGVEELELDVLRRIVERQAQCREYRATEPVGKGPFIGVVDESGSMSGAKIEAAKALILTGAWSARKQHRWCGLIGYSGGTEGNLLALPPGNWDEEALVEWLEHFYDGGTNMDVPLRELPDRYYQELGAPPGVTDIWIITDAICEVPEDMAENFNRWRKAVQAKVYCFVVGHREANSLGGVCDHIYCVPDISPDSEAVGEVLGI